MTAVLWYALLATFVVLIVFAIRAFTSWVYVLRIVAFHAYFLPILFDWPPWFSGPRMIALEALFWCVVLTMVHVAKRSGNEKDEPRARMFIGLTMVWTAFFGALVFIAGICVGMAGLGPGNEANAHLGNEIIAWSAGLTAANCFIGYRLLRA
jgi:hypothetical protein